MGCHPHEVIQTGNFTDPAPCSLYYSPPTCELINLRFWSFITVTKNKTGLVNDTSPLNHKLLVYNLFSYLRTLQERFFFTRMCTSLDSRHGEHWAQGPRVDASKCCPNEEITCHSESICTACELLVIKTVHIWEDPHTPSDGTRQSL